MNAICARCQSPLEPEDLRCAVCSVAVPEGAVAVREQARVDVLRCSECGAAVTYHTHVAAPQCSFCDAVMHVERPLDPLECADHYVPFVVNPDEALALVRRWLEARRGLLVPSGLAREATVQSVHPLYWIGWVCRAQAFVSWTADSDTGAQRAAWAPHAGNADMHFDDLIISASRGLSLDECRGLGPYVLANARPSPESPPDTAVERFDVQRSVARQHILTMLDGIAAARLVRERQIPGHKHRNVRALTLLQRLVTWRYAFPAYVLAYRYRGAQYRVVVHGQNPSRIVGSVPTTLRKVVVAIAVLVGFALIVNLLRPWLE